MDDLFGIPAVSLESIRGIGMLLRTFPTYELAERAAFEDESARIIYRLSVVGTVTRSATVSAVGEPRK